MVKDERIEQALQWGERNKRAMDLVRNWCANMSFERFGGVGLVEQMSGLPIGHFALQCPHAPGARSYGPDLGQNALEFYDANCVGCQFRQPVGFPNLMTLVAERDERRNERALQQERDAKGRADALAAREEARTKIRAKLGRDSASTLDLIAELDGDGEKNAGSKLIEAAALAPETFTPEIIEYLFEKVEAGEMWIVEPALGALARLPVDKTRLSNAALRRVHSGGKIAADLIEKYGEFADEQYIAPALPALISLAKPQSYAIVHEVIEPVEGPLRELYRKRSGAVKAGLKTVLARTEAHNVEIAARGIRFLAKLDTSLVGFATDELLAKLVRAKWLTQGREEEVSQALRDVRKTLVPAFDADPAGVDTLIAGYLDHASKEGAAALHQLYEDVVNRGRRLDDDRDIAPTEAIRLAFRRLVVAAAATDDDDLTGSSYGVFTGEPYELTPLVAEEIDLVLGSAANLAVRIDELRNKPIDRNEPFATMTRQAQLSRLHGLMDCFVRWACIAAGKSGADAIAKVLVVMRNLPEQSDRLRAAIVGNFPGLAGTTDGLKQILPDYYSALVGSSALVRSDAGTALGEMRRAVQDSMPSLVFEAFTALLADPYIIVHKAAARALERFSLPEDRRNDAVRALWGWIQTYAKSRNDDRFLVQLIELFAERYLSDKQVAGPVGDVLLEIATRIDPETIFFESQTGLAVFAANPHYARFFLRLLEDEKLMANMHERVLEQFQRRPLTSLFQERAYAVEVGTKLARQLPWSVAIFIEALTACGAWKEAAKLAAAGHDQIADTKQFRARRLHMKLNAIATAYEAAIAAGKMDELADLERQWRTTLTDIQKDREEDEQKRGSHDRLFGED